MVYFGFRKNLNAFPKFEIFLVTEWVSFPRGILKLLRNAWITFVKVEYVYAQILFLQAWIITYFLNAINYIIFNALMDSKALSVSVSSKVENR